MSLDRLLDALESFREPSEPFGVLIGGATGRHVVRVLIARECVAYAEAPTRGEAVAIALDALGEAGARLADEVFVLAVERES